VAIAGHFQGRVTRRVARATTQGTFSPQWAYRHAGSSLWTSAISAAPAREQALGSASTVAERWRGKGHPKVAEHIEECLCRLVFPASHRRLVRTTSGPERLSQEMKRRTRVVGRIFLNRESCLRLVTALAAEEVALVE
jgi:transposase-like protein